MGKIMESFNWRRGSVERLGFAPVDRIKKSEVLSLRPKHNGLNLYIGNFNNKDPLTNLQGALKQQVSLGGPEPAVVCHIVIKKSPWRDGGDNDTLSDHM